MKKKRTIMILISFVIAFILLIPYIKLWIYSNHYEIIGTHTIFNRKIVNGMEFDSPVHLNTISDNTGDSIKVTNILYYKDLIQLSFGVIGDRNTLKNIDLKIVDKDNNTIGEVGTQGISNNFYNQSLEKLYMILSGKLNMDEEYRILILDTDSNIVGEVVFSN